jgi:hypothetical protein
MSDFSKQWAELYDPEFPWDFDIEEIAKDLHKGNYYPIIDEGFGFTAIAKSSNQGKTLLAFPTGDKTNEVEWKDYNDFMISERSKYLLEIQKLNSE